MKKTMIIHMASLLMLSGCSDVLDVAPDGIITLEQVFTDNDKVAAYLNSCYNYVPAKGNWYYFVTSVPTALSDEGWDADDCVGMRVVQYYNGNVSPGGDPLYEDGSNMKTGTYWQYYWTGIRKCSVFLSQIDNAAVNSENDRQRWKAEAYVLRAYYYMELLKWYGASFPVNKNPYEVNQDFTQLRPAPYGEIVQFIIADCDAALEIEELPWRIVTEAEKMRITKAIAEAIKSKSVLFAVSPRYDDGTYTTGQAYQINKQSLQHLRDNGYELFNRDNTFMSASVYTDPYMDTFEGANKQARINAVGANKEYFCNWADYAPNPRDRETIWQHQQPQDRQWLVASPFGNYKCGVCPTQEYVDAFEITDGAVAYPLLDLSRPYNDVDEPTHLLPNYNPLALNLYDEQNPYKNRDPRFYATIYYHGSKRFIVGENQWTTIYTDVGDQKFGIRPGSSDAYRTFTRTGYYAQKFLHPTEGQHDLSYYGAGWKLFRLGEIILNTAELAVEAGHPAEATPLLNEIRRRSAMPEITGNAGDQATMRLLVRQERRIELGFEEVRYFDVRRWLEKGDDKDLSATDKWITAMEITDVSPTQNHSMHTFVRRPARENPRECYASKFLFMPIPLDEATRLEVITGVHWQTPGW
ncbi:MAG: RagB/SusD family nutrient uptake outer membrane protein [Tannerella sp.]|nr:RagB/SusD family nutrient uptake outer membrane protein [Tannerella sp.]